MTRTQTRISHESQAPVGSEVLGQDDRVFNLRRLAFQAAVVGVIACGLIVAVVAVTS